MRDRAERWAPLAISVAALIFSLLYASHYDRKVAARDREHAERLGRTLAAIEAERDERQHDNSELERKLEIWQAYTMSLIRDMVRGGITPSNLPPQETKP